jgi:hypothetical protein
MSDILRRAVEKLVGVSTDDDDVEIVERLNSDCLSDVSYDPDSQELSVIFRESGASYTYYGVDRRRFERLAYLTPSAGKYFNRSIKNNYPYSPS